jgi:dienelactone hydrolase
MKPVRIFSSDSYINGYFFPSGIDPAITTILFLQGFPGIEGDELICGRLARSGFNCLTFNYRGTFQSEGHFSFRNAIEDIQAARRFLQESDEISLYIEGVEEIVLGGWSFGASLVPKGVVDYQGFRRMLMISGRNFGEEARRIKNDPKYAQEVQRNLRNIRSPKGPVKYQDDLLQDLLDLECDLDHVKLAPKLRECEILLICGLDDMVVPVEEHTLPFYRALRADSETSVRMEVFQDNHDFSGSKERIVGVILDWLRKVECKY